MYYNDRICKYYEKYGKCSYGNKCRFIHDFEDYLKKTNQIPKNAKYEDTLSMETFIPKSWKKKGKKKSNIKEKEKKNNSARCY
jgi:hypothetical protein